MRRNQRGGERREQIFSRGGAHTKEETKGIMETPHGLLCVAVPQNWDLTNQ